MDSTVVKAATSEATGAGFEPPDLHVNSLELGWLVGIIEGEGYIGIVRPKDRKTHRFYISVEMTDEDVVRRLHSITGKGNVNRWERPNHPEWKPSWIWKVQSKKDVVDLLKLIHPHMGERRTARIEEVLALA